MPINIGTSTSDLSQVFVGSTEISEIWAGSNQVWSAPSGFGRPVIDRTLDVAFAGRPDNPGDGVDRFYPYDYTGDPITSNGNAFVWVALPTNTTSITTDGTARVRQLTPTLESPSTENAIVNGSGGAVGYEIPVGAGTGYQINTLAGLSSTTTGRSLYTAASGGTTYTANFTLTGITPWAGNAFYTAPDITSIQTLPSPAGTLSTGGFYVAPVAAGAEIRFEATRSDGAGGTITYADAATAHVGVYVSDPLDTWGLSWVQFFLDSTFYGDPATIGGTGPINIDLRVV